MNIFEDFQARVGAALKTLAAAGRAPADLDLSRFVVEPPREAAHGDLSTNAAMVYAREAKAAGGNPRALAEALAEVLRKTPDVEAVEVAGPGFINIRLALGDIRAGARRHSRARPRFRPRGEAGRRQGQRRICQRQSDRADACRPRARRGVRRRARQSAGLRRPRGDARILRQRRRRAGRRPRALRASCAIARRSARR